MNEYKANSLRELNNDGSLYSVGQRNLHKLVVAHKFHLELNLIVLYRKQKAMLTSSLYLKPN